MIMGDFNSLPRSVVRTLCSDWGATGGDGSSGGAGGTGGSRGGSGGGAADAREAGGGPSAGNGAAAADGIAGVADADATGCWHRSACRRTSRGVWQVFGLQPVSVKGSEPPNNNK